MQGKLNGTFFSEFDFEIKDIKGKENKVAYAISRKIKQLNTISTKKYEIDLEYNIISAPKMIKFIKK